MYPLWSISGTEQILCNENYMLGHDAPGHEIAVLTAEALVREEAGIKCHRAVPAKEGSRLGKASRPKRETYGWSIRPRT